MSSDASNAPIIKYSDIFQSSRIRHGYLKCRLVHLSDRSFVMPEVLFGSGLKKGFFSPRFFTASRILFFGGDGSADHCTFTMELFGGIEVSVAFFKSRLVKKLSDGSFIYKCAYHVPCGDQALSSQGIWRHRGDKFEFLLFHHTNEDGEKGICKSGEIWSSSWNIQGTQRLKNIAYGYFTSLPKIVNDFHLQEVAMSTNGFAHFLPTNAPLDFMFTHALDVYRQETNDRDRCLSFWIDADLLSPNHLWFHMPISEPAYYECVLPRVFRIGLLPGSNIPISGSLLNLRPEECKKFSYVIVGNAGSAAGLIAPYNEEETLELAKIDFIPDDMEIIDRWRQMQNTHIYSSIPVELVQLDKNGA